MSSKKEEITMREPQSLPFMNRLLKNWYCLVKSMGYDVNIMNDILRPFINEFIKLFTYVFIFAHPNTDIAADFRREFDKLDETIYTRMRGKRPIYDHLKYDTLNYYQINDWDFVKYVIECGAVLRSIFSTNKLYGFDRYETWRESYILTMRYIANGDRAEPPLGSHDMEDLQFIIQELRKFNTLHALIVLTLSCVLAIEVNSQVSHLRMCLDHMNNDVVYPNAHSNAASNATTIEEEKTMENCNKYFKSEAAQYIFALIHLRGEEMDRFIGLEKDMYESPLSATKWYNHIMSVIISDESDESRAAQRILVRVYTHIMDGIYDKYDDDNDDDDE